MVQTSDFPYESLSKFPDLPSADIYPRFDFPGGKVEDLSIAAPSDKTCRFAVRSTEYHETRGVVNLRGAHVKNHETIAFPLLTHVSLKYLIHTRSLPQRLRPHPGPPLEP